MKLKEGYKLEIMKHIKTIKIIINLCVLRPGRNLFKMLTMFLTANEIGNF